jgi:Na+-translocating ferredoxin:NAD+ oxidoreductase subunit B
MSFENELYRELQKHLDKMPVGFPATSSGVELRLLKSLFTPEQAQIALELDYKFKSLKEIYRVRNWGISIEKLESRLEGMVDRGNTFGKTRDGVKVYANIPFVVGILELQVNRLTPELLRDTGQYFEEKFAAQYLGTTPQMRVFPVRKSITSEHISNRGLMPKMIISSLISVIYRVPSPILPNPCKSLIQS